MKIPRILVASGAFKDVFSPEEACSMIAGVLRDVVGDVVDIESQPIVDGGEYTSQVISSCLGYNRANVKDIVDPAGNFHESEYYLLNSSTAFIAASSTLALSSMHDDKLRNPLLLTSYGFGQIVKQVCDRGIRNVLIGFGGTSIADGGLGMLQALGATVFDRHDNQLTPVTGKYYTGADLAHAVSIDCNTMRRRYSDVNISALCDTAICVANIAAPTALKVGAYYNKERAGIVEDLVSSLNNYSRLLGKQEYTKKLLRSWPGHGSLAERHYYGVAGGVLMSLAQVFRITPSLGVEYFIKLFNINEKVARADLVFSGEGCFDSTWAGKTPSGIARIARQNNKPCICLCGTVGAEYKKYFTSCVSNDLPEKIIGAGFTTIISCHPEYEKEMSGKTYREELSYYRENTPTILRKVLGVFLCGPAGKQ